MRRILVALATLMPAATFAGDYAERHVLGFSPDGASFAFVEYGVQDGSGFPYANAYVIDTVTDSWVAGTPVRVLIEDETSSAGAAYAQALEGIRAVVEARGIGTPAAVVAHNPLTEVSADPFAVSFLLRMPVPPPAPGEARAHTLSLVELPLPAANCPDLTGEPFKGFRLTLTDPTGAARLLNDDKSIPASRRCPIGYRISEVMLDPSLTVMAVLVDVMSVGFEGPDRRFLAVTTRLP